MLISPVSGSLRKGVKYDRRPSLRKFFGLQKIFSVIKIFLKIIPSTFPLLLDHLDTMPTSDLEEIVGEMRFFQDARRAQKALVLGERKILLLQKIFKP